MTNDILFEWFKKWVNLLEEIEAWFVGKKWALGLELISSVLPYHSGMNAFYTHVLKEPSILHIRNRTKRRNTMYMMYGDYCNDGVK